MEQPVPVTQTEERPEEPDSPEPQNEESSENEDDFVEEDFDYKIKLALDFIENIKKLEELSRLEMPVETIVLKLDGQAKRHQNRLLDVLRRGHSIPKSEAKNFKARMDKLDRWSRRLKVFKKEKARITAKLEKHRDKVSYYISEMGHNPFWFRWQMSYGWLPREVSLFRNKHHNLNCMGCSEK